MSFGNCGSCALLLSWRTTQLTPWPRSPAVLSIRMHRRVCLKRDCLAMPGFVISPYLCLLPILRNPTGVELDNGTSFGQWKMGRRDPMPIWSVGCKALSPESLHFHLEKIMSQIIVRWPLQNESQMKQNGTELQHEGVVPTGPCTCRAHPQESRLPEPASISQATADLQPRKHRRKWWLISVIEIWSCLLFSIIVLFRKLFREITNNVCLIVG